MHRLQDGKCTLCIMQLRGKLFHAPPCAVRTTNQRLAVSLREKTLCDCDQFGQSRAGHQQQQQQRPASRSIHPSPLSHIAPCAFRRAWKSLKSEAIGRAIIETKAIGCASPRWWAWHYCLPVGRILTAPSMYATDMMIDFPDACHAQPTRKF